MFEFIKRIFPRRRKEVYGAEELRITFKERYEQFKLLLKANSEVLEIMAEIEEALKGIQPFGMTFVRERCTRASMNVYRIIKHLNNLAPGKYKALNDKYSEIREKIIPYLHSRNLQDEGPLVVSLDGIHKELADQVGGKMANLGEIKNRIGLTVPNGFVITTAGYHRFMEHSQLQLEIDLKMQASRMEQLDELYKLSEALQRLIISAPIPSDLEAAISEHYQSLQTAEGEGLSMAVRSSALGEDLRDSSFAGLYRSVLNVEKANILHTYKEILASKYSLPAITYRLSHGMLDEDVAMCVGCMSMVDAVAGGVLYSRNPLNIRDDSIVIDSSWGLPKLVVDGSAEVDHFVISRHDPFGISQREIPVKEYMYTCLPNKGVCRKEIAGEQAQEASINDDQVLELAHLAIRLEEYYQAPQDIEWCLSKDQSIVVLQCRPLKQIDVSEHEVERRGKEPEQGTVILQGGITASPGVAAGPVFFVKKDTDVLNFPEGAILVSEQALPRWATLLNRASAVVTEQGGIAGHLANVAREFSVPALFSVKRAVEVLSPGQVITVDADGLKVYEGRIHELLEKEEKAANLMMEGSPVYEALKGAAEYIVRLNLLDPDAITFRPEDCTTFHDITRFCHEKSVSEMFNFGKDHRFPELSSKQLLVDVPMQWWVLNLDDGFSEEVEGKYVKIDNIQSIPMLALWEGIIAVPWAGPPPVDGKGFMSIMLQATQNPALATGAPSKYAERNYFMVSRDYCSLSSRLGFHFSTVEALVTDSPSENYISFQFKGGATDHERKRKRIFFIKEILEEYHYRVEVKEDNLIARLEDCGKDLMIKNLRIVGYLTIHTKQLDMIMSNNALVRQYRAKIRKDIEDLFAGEKGPYLGDTEERHGK